MSAKWILLLCLVIGIGLSRTIELDTLPDYLYDEEEEEEEIEEEFLEMSYKSFLDRFSDTYGYNDTIDSIRANDLKRFKNSAYLDYTGAGQYLDSQVFQCAQLMVDNLYGNSHSRSPSSLNTEKRVIH